VTFTQVFGHVLRTLREAHSPPISAAEMAEKMGKSRPGWWYVESGTNTLDPAQVYLAATALGVTPGEVYVRTEQICNRLRAAGCTVLMQRVPRKEKAEAQRIKVGTGVVGSLLGAMSAAGAAGALAAGAAVGSLLGAIGATTDAFPAEEDDS
jgi:transcriptional regulator with XRE-family HTH domain